jgi:alanyl-tRNA synthetase
VAAANNENDFFKTDIFTDMIEIMEKSSDKSYDNPEYQKSFRIIMDHIKSAVLMIADGLVPSNKEAGYVLRRLIRRAVFNMKHIDFNFKDIEKLTEAIAKKYGPIYENVQINSEVITKELEGEIKKFRDTLEKGLKEFEKIVDIDNTKNNICKIDFGQIEISQNGKNQISGEDAFFLFTSYGFPIEIIVEEAEKRSLSVDTKRFEGLLKKHSTDSNTSSAIKFKGGLGGDSPKITAFHTSNHLMLAALQKYAGDQVHQQGSNITEDRARFDFTHEGKVDREILDKVEKYVNDAIEKEIEMVQMEMSKQDAKAEGVEGSF